MSRREHNFNYREAIRYGRQLISARAAYVIRSFPETAGTVIRLTMEATRTTKRAVGERVYEEIEAIYQTAKRARKARMMSGSPGRP